MFSPQPETLKYLNFVADKFNLREHMQFDCYVESMQFDEANCIWVLQMRRQNHHHPICIDSYRAAISANSASDQRN